MFRSIGAGAFVASPHSRTVSGVVTEDAFSIAEVSSTPVEFF
jgi:hypothetical protein